MISGADDGPQVLSGADSDPPRASGGSRTRNPRITNAVLCQLKLRWHDPRTPRGRPEERVSPAKLAHGPPDRQVRPVFQAFRDSLGEVATNRAGTNPRGTTGAEKKKWGLRLDRSTLSWACGSGARRPHARRKPETPPWYSKSVDCGRGRSRCHRREGKHMPCQTRIFVFCVFFRVSLCRRVFKNAARAAFRSRSIRCCNPVWIPCPQAEA